MNSLEDTRTSISHSIIASSLVARTGKSWGEGGMLATFVCGDVRAIFLGLKSSL